MVCMAQRIYILKSECLNAHSYHIKEITLSSSKCSSIIFSKRKGDLRPVILI